MSRKIYAYLAKSKEAFTGLLNHKYANKNFVCSYVKIERYRRLQSDLDQLNDRKKSGLISLTFDK